MHADAAALPKPGRGDPRGGPRLDQAAVGIYVHAAIANSLVSADKSTAAVVDEVLARAGTRNPALRVRVTAFVSRYLNEFVPATDELIGVEVEGTGCRFDLLWRRGDRIWADEIKTSRAQSAQLVRLVRAGTERWGDRFVGVRVVFLTGRGAALLIGARHEGNR